MRSVITSRVTCILHAVLAVALLCPAVLAQDKKESGEPKEPSAGGVGVSIEPRENDPPAGRQPRVTTVDASRDQRFAEYMTGATLTGRFTVLGSEQDELPAEQYTIVKCEKLTAPDMFRFTAKLKYGETETEVPMEFPVYFAGDTPVISLTDLSIPTLGTFSARVVIYRGSYAGTWQHNEKGGHLFGTIESDAEGDFSSKRSKSVESTPKAFDGPVDISVQSSDKTP